jgi:hypothetical protein
LSIVTHGCEEIAGPAKSANGVEEDMYFILRGH